MNQTTNKIQQLTLKLQKLGEAKKYKHMLALIVKQKKDVQYHVDIRKLKAVALLNLHKYEMAEKLLLDILKTHPDEPDVNNNLAVCYRRSKNLKKIDDAFKFSKRSIELDPKNLSYHLTLSALHKLNRDSLATIVTLKNAGMIYPDNYQIRIELATTLNSVGDHLEAIEHAAHVEQTMQSLLIQLDARIRLNHYDKAKALIPRLLDKYDVNDRRLALIFIGQLSKLGEFQLANQLLAKIPPAHTAAYFVALIQSGEILQDDLVKISEVVTSRPLTNKEQKNVYFAISKQFFKFKDYDRAFKFCHLANEISILTDDVKKDIDRAFDTIKSRYKKQNLPDYRGFDNDLPVFIVGMPRSGTTLLENIIASHSNAFGAGETPYMRRILTGKYVKSVSHESQASYWNECQDWTDEYCAKIAGQYIRALRTFDNDAKRIVDKMPHNFMHVGMIKHLFPKAHVIHIRRNPIACCLSIYQQNFTEFHYYGSDLEYLPEYYKKYNDLMSFWRQNIDKSNYLEIDYEDLVVNNEETVRKVLDFIGLDFEQACIDFHKSKRAVSTASKEQVRSKLYTSSITPWHGIEHEIQPIIDAFPEAAKVTIDDY